jgi:hypothetical protein
LADDPSICSIDYCSGSFYTYNNQEQMNVTFNDGETQRILKEFAAVLSNKLDRAKTTRQAIRVENSEVKKYSKILNGWVLSKIKTNYKAKIVKL